MIGEWLRRFEPRFAFLSPASHGIVSGLDRLTVGTAQFPSFAQQRAFCVPRVCRNREVDSNAAEGPEVCRPGLGQSRNPSGIGSGVTRGPGVIDP